MATYSAVSRRVLGEVRRTHGCDLDTLRQNLSDLSWSQVFLEVDRLSRRGELLVTFGARGRYMIRLADQKQEPVAHPIKS